jgi:hypothetical protein
VPGNARQDHTQCATDVVALLMVQAIVSLLTWASWAVAAARVEERIDDRFSDEPYSDLQLPDG